MPDGASPGYSNVIGSATYQIVVGADSFESEMGRLKLRAEKASKSIGQSFGQGSDAARGLLYLGQAVDDVQYGFHAIVNNIPQLVAAMGGGAGLAGAIGIVAVGVNQLITHWDQLVGTWGEGHTSEEAARMATLAAETKKAAEEAQKLREAAPAKYEKSGKEIGKLIAENVGVEVEESIRKAMTREAAKMPSPAGGEETLVEPTPGAFGRTWLGRGVRALRKWWNTGGPPEDQGQATREQAAELFGRLGMGDANAQRIVREMAKRNPDLFPFGFAEKMEEAVPAKMEQKEIAARRKKVEEALERRTQRELRELDEEERGRKELWERDKRVKIEGLQDEAEALTKRRHELQERIRETGRPQVFASGAELARSLMTSAMGPKTELEEFKKMNKQLEKIHDAIKVQQRARFN